MEIVARDIALAEGRKHYFTREPCLHGHLAPRYTVNQRCVKCAFEGWGEGLYIPRIKARLAGEQFYQGRRCPQGHSGTRYATSGVCVECAKERAVARMDRIAKATPPWFADGDKARIRRTNALARLMSAITGEPWELDHIIPLSGRNVCGLHVGGNVQAVPRAISRRKSNKFEPLESEVLA